MSVKKKHVSPTEKFKVSFVVEAELEISKDLLKSVLTEDFQSSHYDLRTGQEVADHIAYNLLRGTNLTSMDGFADQPPGSVNLIRSSWDLQEE